MDARIFDAVEDETTRDALYELWKSARESARDLNDMIEKMKSDFEGRVSALEGRMAQLEGRNNRGEH